MRLRLRRLLIVSGALLLALELLYLAAANYLLSSARVQMLVNRNPERFALRWGGAWTAWPGAVRLRDVEMRGRSSTIEWYARLDEVSASYGLLPLLDGTVHLGSVSARGIDYRQRRRARPGEDPRATDPGLPPLPGFEAPGGDSRGRASRGKERGKPWTIIADEIDAGVEQIWIDRHRLAGRMHLGASMRLVTRGPMEFPRIRFKVAEGDLLQGERVVFGGLRADVETAIPRVDPRGLRGPGFLKVLSGRFRLRSRATSLFFLEPFFERAPWLHFDGRSSGKADLILDRGRLQPGSTLESDVADVNVAFLDRTLRGHGLVRAKVEEAADGRRARIEVTLDKFALSATGDDAPYAHGRGFRVAAVSTSLDLRDPFTTLDVSADLPEAVIPDLSWYNRYVPRGAGLAIRSGSGRIEYHVRGSHEERSLRGTLLLEGQDVVAQLDKYVARGDFEIRTLLRDLRVREGRFDVSGTRIELRSDNFPWAATITLPRAEITYSKPMRAEADIVMAMTDTAPLVALFDAQKDVSRFVERLLTIHDIKASASMRIGRSGVEIEGIDVTGEDLQVLADLALHEGVKDGILYIKFHAFSVGVEIRNGRKELDLVRARKWFEKRRAQRDVPP